MKINTKIRYGLRAMMDIAISDDPNGVLQKDISRHQDISLKYLDSIISALKVKGLIVNAKGKGSGYRLSRPASEITMLDIYTTFEPLIVVQCINNKDFCDRSGNCMAKTYWCQFKEEIREILIKKNLAQIIKEEIKVNRNE